MSPHPQGGTALSPNRPNDLFDLFLISIKLLIIRGGWPPVFESCCTGVPHRRIPCPVVLARGWPTGIRCVCPSGHRASGRGLVPLKMSLFVFLDAKQTLQGSYPRGTQTSDTGGRLNITVALKGVAQDAGRRRD